MHTLKGYKLRGVFFGPGNIPVEQLEVTLPSLVPESETKWELAFSVSDPPVRVDVLRPTGFSVAALDWKT